MSKSNAVEIIAILWLIAGLLATGWISLLFYALAIQNTIESIWYAIKTKEKTKL